MLLIEHLGKGKRIRYSVEQSGADPTVFGDENQLKQVMINLLKNSIEAILHAGSIVVAIDTPDDGGGVQVTITDDGCGIPDDLLPRIFDPFVSSKITKQNTGLGLSICQHIIENHDGMIECRSTAGTTMTLRFPRVQ